jgi:anti-sigma28 factor (negative regulator of flagellin synthesis)
MNKIEELYYSIGHFDTHMLLDRKEIDDAIKSIKTKIAALKAQRTKEKRNIAALRKYKSIWVDHTEISHDSTFTVWYAPGDILLDAKLNKIKQAIREGNIN